MAEDNNNNVKYIKPQEGFQEAFVRSSLDVVIGGGVLNPQPLDSLVSTPDGFVRIGDIKVGDIIHNPMGGTQKVNFVIDKGLQECVEFTLQDGRKVQSALSHHWMVRNRHGKILDLSAEDIIMYIDESKKRDCKHVNRLRIPMSEPVSFKERNELKIHPYMLGCLLGDGCLSSKLYRADLACHSKDIELIERLRGLGYNIVKESKNENSLHYCIKDKEVVGFLKELGLWGKLCYDKFIPSSYKYSSLKDRMELLKGLFDTDGCCSKANSNRNSRVGYRTTSKQLAKDIQELIWSIGGRCVIHTTEETKRIQNGKVVNCAKSYGLLIWTKNDKDLFFLERKREKAMLEVNRKCSTMLSIMDYKLIGKKEVRCINVSGDEHIYLTDGYVVTRNCGKAQPLNSKVLTPHGFVNMGDLKVGDTITGSDGGEQQVLNIFERGVLNRIIFTFDDDTKVECCPEHLWTVWDKHENTYKTLEAKFIIKNLDRYSIDLPKKQKFGNNEELPLNPYLLGVLLGKKSHDKFIPNVYLNSNIDNRTLILQGLFDTDGYNDKRHSRIEYCTTSKDLADNVSFLVRSLGGKVSVIEKTDSYKKNGEKIICKKAYKLICRFENPNEMFRLPHKQNGLKTKNTIRKKFVSVDKVNPTYMRCIVVSNPDHLYITDGFNLTHNSFAAILATAEPALDPSFRACFTRRTFGELRSGGSLTDDFKVAFGDAVTLKTTDPPRVTFIDSGALVDFRQINDESIKKVTETWKGSQYDFIYMDELTSYEFSTFKYLLTRNRGKAKWSGKFRGTTNPEKDCWVRTFIDWYVGADGLIREDRNGVVRYFYLQGETVDEVVWGDSKEEVYKKCKVDIDRKLKALGGDFTYKNMIKSFTFYLGRMSENKASIGNNMDYAGSVAAVGGRQAQQLVEGNWNCSLKDDSEMPLPYGIAEGVFSNDARINGDKWITADLADTGDDNTSIWVWNGLHIIDYKLIGKSTPAMNAEYLKLMAAKHDIPDNHIIYDAIRAAYIYDYIPEAIAFKSYSRVLPNSKYGRLYFNLKDDCYARLVEVIRRQMLSFEDHIPNDQYTHRNIKTEISIRTEFIEECLVVKFKELHGGKKTLLNKKEMNQLLGKGRSMDVLDPMAMRMLPLLSYEYGQELIETEAHQEEKTERGKYRANIYDEDTWC